MDYTIVVTGPVDDTGMSSEPGYIGGGMMQRGGEAAAPVVTIDVDDIDEALKKIESLGGETVAPRSPVGTMGFAAYFRDSEGNLMGLWETARES